MEKINGYGGLEKVMDALKGFTDADKQEILKTAMLVLRTKQQTEGLQKNVQQEGE